MVLLWNLKVIFLGPWGDLMSSLGAGIVRTPLGGLALGISTGIGMEGLGESLSLLVVCVKLPWTHK